MHLSSVLQSPNSWCNDWKMQPRHDEYEQRYTEASANNPNYIKQKGAEEFTIRFNEELQRRADAAIV